MAGKGSTEEKLQHLLEEKQRMNADFFRDRLEKKLPDMMNRLRALSSVSAPIDFSAIVNEARTLYVDGSSMGSVALCLIGVQVVCIKVAQRNVRNNEVLVRLVDPDSLNLRDKVLMLTPYFEDERTVSVLLAIVEISKNILSLYGTELPEEEALACIKNFEKAVSYEFRDRDER